MVNGTGSCPEPICFYFDLTNITRSLFTKKDGCFRHAEHTAILVTICCENFQYNGLKEQKERIKFPSYRKE